MIPEFPQFKNLELSDKKDVEAITKKYPPYSDFNFVSMWSWDIKGEMRLSMLNGNLVVKFTDYLTSEQFYSFLGNIKVNDTVKKLIDLSEKEGLSKQLKLIPEYSIKSLNQKLFHLIEERDHFDYILDLNLLARPNGHKFKSKRKSINDLVSKNKCKIVVLDGTEEHIISSMHELSKKVEANLRTKDVSFSTTEELIAIKRVLESIKILDLVIVTAFVDEKLCGFAIKEIVSNDYAIGHFLKADISVFPATYSYLMQQLALVMINRGCKFINIEQDLGLQGLRSWKESYKPDHFLRKYKVVKII